MDRLDNQRGEKLWKNNDMVFVKNDLYIDSPLHSSKRNAEVDQVIFLPSHLQKLS